MTGIENLKSHTRAAIRDAGGDVGLLLPVIESALKANPNLNVAKHLKTLRATPRFYAYFI